MEEVDQVVAHIVQVVAVLNAATIPHLLPVRLVDTAVEQHAATIPHLLPVQLVETAVEQHAATIPHLLPVQLVDTAVVLSVVTIRHRLVQIVLRSARRNVRVKPRKHVLIALQDVVQVVVTTVITSVQITVEEHAGYRVEENVKTNVDMVAAKWSVSDMASWHIVHHVVIHAQALVMRTVLLIVTLHVRVMVEYKAILRHD